VQKLYALAQVQRQAAPTRQANAATTCLPPAGMQTPLQAKNKRARAANSASTAVKIDAGAQATKRRGKKRRR